MRIPILILMAAITPAFSQEQTDKWTSLFNGRNLDGWMWSTVNPPPQPSWVVEDGVIKATPGKGTPTYLLTRDSYTDYELAFDWKVERGANSGVKYRFQGYSAKGKVIAEPDGPGRIEPLALEYQIADDENEPDSLSSPRHSTASIYEYVTPSKDGPAKAEVWHSSRIVVRGVHIEHWLDGKKVVNANLDAPEVQAAFAASTRKQTSPILAKQERRTSPIALQFHNGVVWFRELKIRRL